MLTVAEIMTPEPYTLTPAHSLRDAAELMRDHHIRHIPLLREDGGIVGIVSQRDVLAASHSSLALEPAGDGVDDVESCVALESVMSSPVLTVSVDERLIAVAARLRRQRIGCMPVTRDGRLVGVISDSDFLEVSMVLLEQVRASDFEEID